MAKNKRGLGRGLDALFEEKSINRDKEKSDSINFISMIC